MGTYLSQNQASSSSPAPDHHSQNTAIPTMTREDAHEIACIMGELERKLAEDMDIFDELALFIEVPSAIIDGYESGFIWLSSLVTTLSATPTMKREDTHGIAQVLWDLERMLVVDMDAFNELELFIEVPSDVTEGSVSSLIWMGSLMEQVSAQIY